MFDDEKQVIDCARRWYASAKTTRDPILTHQLACQLAVAVLIFEKARSLKPLKPKPLAAVHDDGPIDVDLRRKSRPRTTSPMSKGVE